MSLRVHNPFTPETDLESANEKLRAIHQIILPRAALTSTVQLRRILGLPDQPDMAIETRLELIKDSNIPDKEWIAKVQRALDELGEDSRKGKVKTQF